jgi:hypothetical protein
MLEILDRAGMVECKPSSTPVQISSKLAADGPPVQDPSDYRSLAGALQWLTFMHPDISYAIQQVCLYMHDPREPHLAALKRILCYVCVTLDLGLLLQPSDSGDLIVYSDADWAGCPDTRRSTSGYAVFLGGNLVSWSSKRQNTVSRSSAEAEYHVVANGVAEATWLQQLLLELHAPPRRVTLVYCDNVNAVYMSSNPVQHLLTPKFGKESDLWVRLDEESVWWKEGSFQRYSAKRSAAGYLPVQQRNSRADFAGLDGDVAQAARANG